MPIPTQDPDRPRPAEPLPAAAAARLLARLDADTLPARARVLVLGERAASVAAALRARGHEVAGLPPGEDDDALTALANSAPSSFDGVVAVGFIERQPWDRWALQRIHRLLRDRGVLLLAVPDLFSPLSLVDPRYVAARIAKQFRRRLGPGAAGAAPRAGRELRAYAARRLRATLAELGFTVGRWSGFAATPARASAGLGAWVPTHHLVLARRSAGGADGASADPGAARRRFEAANRPFLAARAAWCRRHGIVPGPARPLDPGRFAGEQVLVLSPHPDDEIIGCGGTLLRLVRAGARVTVLQATDGSASAALAAAPPGVRRTVRLDEARAVATAAGFEPTLFWGEDNHAFAFRDDLVADLRGTLARLAPALVFTPFLADAHEDHRTLNRILAAALAERPGPGPEILGYEVWSLAPANLWCDVTANMADLERLLLLYETAMKVDDFVHMCGARNRYHALALGGGAGAAEAFFAADPRRFRALVAADPPAGGGAADPVLPSPPSP